MESLTFETPLALSEDAQNLLFREARTANKFTDEPVSTETIEAIYELVKFGPTAMNNQPLWLLLVQSDEGRAGLGPHMSEGNRAKTNSAPVVAILAADTDFHDRLPSTSRTFPKRVTFRRKGRAPQGSGDIQRRPPDRLFHRRRTGCRADGWFRQGRRR